MLLLFHRSNNTGILCNHADHQYGTHCIILVLLIFGDGELMSSGFYIGLSIILFAIISNSIGVIKLKQGEEWLKNEGDEAIS